MFIELHKVNNRAKVYEGSDPISVAILFNCDSIAYVYDCIVEECRHRFRFAIISLNGKDDDIAVTETTEQIIKAMLK